MVREKLCHKPCDAMRHVFAGKRGMLACATTNRAGDPSPSSPSGQARHLKMPIVRVDRAMLLPLLAK
jgi:hypothetical protein